MCGRYTLTQPKKIKSRFNTENDIENEDPSYNVAPAQYLPTITRNSPNKITMMKWGFIPHWSKNKKFSLINIRSETVKEKIYFRNILLNNRCLIPSDGFFEWKKIAVEGKEEKIPHYFHLKQNKLFSFAGLFNKLKDAEGKDIFTFAILTTTPNSLVKKVHNRMPVILSEKEENTWLQQNSDQESLFKLLDPYPAAKMASYVVSKKVNNTRNDDSSLLKRV